MPSSSRSITSEIWFISSSEVPGADVVEMSAVSSRKAGRKSFPIRGYSEIAPATASAARPSSR